MNPSSRVPFSQSRRVLEELMRPKRILLVEDNEMWRELLLEQMKEYHQVTSVASDGIEACELIAANQYDSIILDLHLPKKSGTEVFRFIRQRDPIMRVAIVSAYFDPTIWSELNKIGFRCDIPKSSDYSATFFEALMVALAVDKKR